MPKGQQRGNREAKKPKKPAAVAPIPVASAIVLAAPKAAPRSLKK